MRGSTLDRLIYAGTTLACALPLAWTLANSGASSLQTQAELLAFTGTWSLRLLILVLLIRPMAQLSHQRWVIRCRRIIGLFVFGYAAAHLFLYLVGNQGWRVLPQLVTEPYLFTGVLAFVLLIPMAATSFNAMVKLVGGDRWKRIHQAIYVIAPLSVVHDFLAKGSATEAVIYGVLVAILLGYRFYVWWTSPRRRAAAARAG